MHALLRSMVPIIIAAGCAGSNIKPQDTGVAGHERAASEHEASAVNWKQGDKRSLDEHRAAAAQHRAASAALRAAEAQACVGISPEDRDMSPFEHAGDIASVGPFVESVSVGGEGGGVYKRPAGAVVTFLAVPGMTAEWLQRLVDCHLARNAALGNVVPEMPNCPVVPRGAEARVQSNGNGFAVEIRSDDPATAREILARAQRLVAPQTTSRR